MMYCDYCETLIDENDLVKKIATESDYYSKMGEHVYVCPICGESVTLFNAESCEICGEPIAPDTHFCQSCHDRINKGVESLIREFKGDWFESKSAFFDYLEREWF